MNLRVFLFNKTGDFGWLQTIIVIRRFAQSRQQQTDRMKDPFNPLLRIVSESGARHERIWDETRPHLGGGTTAPGTRHD